MRLSEIIKAYRDSNGLSQRRFASLCKDISNGYLSMIENEVNPSTGKPIVPSLPKLKSIAEAMGMTLDTLISMADDMDVDISSAQRETLPINVFKIAEESSQRVRVLGEIAAGKPLYMEEDYETWVDAPMKADFALIVRGDSMYPTYLDGDVVYIREQPDVDDGQVAAVAVDDSATLKHVYHLVNGINLISDNPAHLPIFVDPAEQEIRILGIVVGFTRMYANVNKLAGVSKGMPRK